MNKIKVIFSFIVLLSLLFETAVPAYANETADDYDYSIYSMETGEISYHRIAENDEAEPIHIESYPTQMEIPTGETVDPAKIVGQDNRSKVAITTDRPYSYTLHISVTREDGASS